MPLFTLLAVFRGKNSDAQDRPDLPNRERKHALMQSFTSFASGRCR